MHYNSIITICANEYTQFY